LLTSCGKQELVNIMHHRIPLVTWINYKPEAGVVTLEFYKIWNAVTSEIWLAIGVYFCFISFVALHAQYVPNYLVLNIKENGQPLIWFHCACMVTVTVRWLYSNGFIGRRWWTWLIINHICLADVCCKWEPKRGDGERFPILP
jgi:hypothetical protein